MPHIFRPESGNSAGMAPESAGMAPESAGMTGFRRNGTGIAQFLRNETGIRHKKPKDSPGIHLIH